DRVRIDGALAQDPVSIEQVARLDDPLLHTHELLADDVPLLLGITGGGQGRQKLLLRVLDRHGARAKPVEHAAHEIRLPLPHQAGVDVNAAHASGRQRAQTERVGDGGIHAAADEEEHVAVADAIANSLFDLRDTVSRIPVWRAAADAEYEVREDFAPVRRVDHLGMKLHAVEAAHRLPDSGNGTGFGPRQHGESRGHGRDEVAMAHPDLLRPREPAKSRRVNAVQFERRQAVFPLLALLHGSAEQVRHELLPVADSEHRPAAAKDRRIYRGTAGIVNAGRPARNDDPARAGKLSGRRLAGPHLGIYAQIPNLARDQMTILSSCVQDDDLRCGLQTLVYDRSARSSRLLKQVPESVFATRRRIEFNRLGWRKRTLPAFFGDL